jgi:hypothetical protein
MDRDHSSTPTWILLQPLLMRLARPVDAAARDELWHALEAGQIRHWLDIGGIHWPLSLTLARDPVDGRTMLTAELWDLVDRARGVLEHPMGVARPIKVCEEDFRAWSRRGQSPEANADDAAGAPEPKQQESKLEWRPSNAPKNLPERVAQVLYNLHQRDEINVMARPSAYSMAAKVQTRLELKKPISKATLDRGLALARKAVEGSH